MLVRARRILIGLAIALGAAVANHLQLAWWWTLTLAGSALFVWWIVEMGGPPTGVRRLREYVGENASESFVTSMSSLPMYRFVDLFRACEDWAQRNDAHPIDMDCAASLGELLGRTWPEANRGAAQAPVSSAYPIGPEQEAFFPSSRFWATYSPRATCVRFTREPHMPRIRIEVAATDRETTETTLAAILKRSVEESIFRGQRVAVENSPAVMHEDDYGIATAAGPMALRFHTLSEIKDDDIVIESEIEEMLRRNIVDPQTHRQAFRAQSIPTQRGVLFFGPPGTGKTYACRHLFSKLPESTILVATGDALGRVREIFELARTLAPSVVVMEDVDLVLSSRELNVLHGGTLGALMDEMDGLQTNEDIILILTTNAIDRIEAAIRDRPGRISQAVHFGPPTAALRRRYLEHALHALSTQAVDLDRLTAMTEGSTQAFLTEWVNRALQFSLETAGYDTDKAVLSTANFEQALREMRRFSEADKIIGFQAS